MARAKTSRTVPPPKSGGKTAPRRPRELALRHLRFGWWSLLVFLTLGLVLEAFHGFKVGWYLDLANETRRLMWTLGHAHGTLLALVNVGYGATLGTSAAGTGSLASRWLMAASVLMPAGFLLGGLVTYGGDPGPGIVLVALGGLMLLAAILSIARGLGARSGETRKP